MTVKTKKYKIVQIGNSKGIRLPKEVMKKYGFSESLIVEELEDGLLLKRTDKKLSWSETYKAMAREREEWSDFEVTLQDGIEKDGFDTEEI
ncbi:AbrB/MazE/SpoVT family DNA-binding domain-containing protein [bacterium]|nr:AbrB/MazE/SpoVT family DNA-binding domain-containing protein [bacterium]